MRKNRGITLVALVVTLILLLIISGITISQLTESGLFKKAQLAKERSENAKQLENERLSDYESEINNYVGGSRESFSESKLLLTVTETSWTEYEIPNLDSYKYFIAYLYWPSHNEIVTEMTFWPEQLKKASETSFWIAPAYENAQGCICYVSENKIKARISYASMMTIYGIK